MILVTHLWQSTLCAGVAALLAAVSRRERARVRHGIWLCASLKFLVPFALIVAAGRRVAEWALPSPTPRVSVAIRWLDQSLSFWNLDGAAGSTGSGYAFAIPRLLLLVLFAVWATGAAGLMLWRWNRWRGLSRLARAATRLEDGRERAALERIPRCSTRPRRIELGLCPSILEPGILGILRPTLLWPAGLSDRLTDAELEAVLTHELCHVDRRDNLSGLLQMAVETLFWFHPVVWWLGARLVSERERACDEEVVRMGSERRSYAESILKVCAFCLRSPLACVAGVGGSDLTQRIENIMSRPAARPLTIPRRVLLVSVGILVTSAPLATGVVSAHRQAIPRATAGDEASQTLPTSSLQPATQDSPKVYGPADGVKMPKVVHEVKPQYTHEAMEAGIQGNLTLEAVVLEDGGVGEVEVVRSLDPVHGLDNEAVKAMKQWRFDPGTKGGKAVAVKVEVEMTFKLK